MTDENGDRAMLSSLNRKLAGKPPQRPDRALRVQIADWTSYEHVRRHRGHAEASAYVHAEFEAAAKIGIWHGIIPYVAIFSVLVVVVTLLSIALH